MAKKNDKPGAGKGGNVPPPEHRWPKGVSGNPAGRTTAGAYLTEWVNALKLATDDELLCIIRDAGAPRLKRTAAENILRTGMPPLALYEGLVSGTQTPAELEAAGVDTAVIKKLKERQEFNAEGEVVGVTREIELHNLAGEEFDRICDRTEGKPKQQVSLDGNLGIPQSITMNVVGPKR